MKSVSIATLASLVSCTLLVACKSEPAPVGMRMEAMSFANSEWSTPVNLAAINTGAAEAQATFSPDELSLYFQSDRTGDPDIWVSHRACRECDWEPPVILGSDVNTTGDENAPHYQQSAEPGGAELYFTRGPAGTQGQDLYAAPITRNGETAGPAVFLSELNHPTANDAAPTVRTDGKEVWFHRGAPAGGLGLSDLWVSTRRGANDPWSTPENPGAPLNSAAFEQQPSLSFDGRSLVFTSNRPGSVPASTGGLSLDIWMATRTVNGK